MSEHSEFQLWSRALGELSRRMAAQTFDAWLRPLQFLDLAPSDRGGGVVLLGAPNPFARDWVSRHYGPLIEDVLASLSGASWRVHWTCSAEERNVEPPPADSQSPLAGGVARTSDRPPSSESPPLGVPVRARTAATQGVPTHTTVRSQPPPAAPASIRRVSTPRRSGAVEAARTASTRNELATLYSSTHAIAARLHPRYTFEHFISGPSNQLAHAAAVSAAAFSSRRFNPLFLCGGTGLGKTHLVNAIGHRLLAERPDARVLYVSAEHFTNEYIASLQSRTMDEFRARYRSACDALLIDDVQFLAEREQTQEEFFHTFNALYLQDRPIVLTSDVLPQDLRGMAERLVSRFASGMVAEIYPPEMETRIAIIRKKADLERIFVEDEAAFLIATSVASNVRDLEGMLMKLAIKASLEGRAAIDAALVRDSLRLPQRAAVLTIEDIQRIVCEHYRVKLAQLIGRERHQGITRPRQIAMFLCREQLHASFPQIGARFGGKDHTTVMSAVQKIRSKLADDPTLRREVEILLARIGPLPSRA